MADQIVAKDEGTSFALPPETQCGAVCCDVVDLGFEFSEKYNKNDHKCAIIFQVDERDPATGKRFELSARFTVSMNEKANLRKFLGQWRGKSYSDDEAKVGAPLHKLVGANAIVQIEHKPSSATGKVHANIQSIMRAIAGAPKLEVEDYVRSPYWAKLKEANAAAANARAAAAAAASNGQHADEPSEVDDDDDLPF